MRCLALIVVVFFPTITNAADPTPEKVKADLKGKWEPTKQYTSGKEEPKADWIQLAWEFTGDEVVITIKGVGGMANSSVRYALSVDPRKSPAHIDLTSRNPKLGFIGIYKLDGDSLTICWNAGRETRPEKFETSKKDFAYLIEFKRQK
jgi:uncharacterized protein (TIGR03067 family)